MCEGERERERLRLLPYTFKCFFRADNSNLTCVVDFREMCRPRLRTNFGVHNVIFKYNLHKKCSVKPLRKLATGKRHQQQQNSFAVCVLSVKLKNTPVRQWYRFVRYENNLQPIDALLILL